MNLIRIDLEKLKDKSDGAWSNRRIKRATERYLRVSGAKFDNWKFWGFHCKPLKLAIDKL